MTAYTPWLVTLDAVRLHRGLADTETDDDPLLSDLIASLSAEVVAVGQDTLGRVPMPYRDSWLASPDDVRGLSLRVPDLLEVAALANVDGADVGSTLYALRPDNVYPKQRIDLKSASGAYWRFVTPDDRAQVDGWFGYVPHYPACWRSSGIVLPAGGLTDSAASVTFAAAQTLEIGAYARCEDEIMQIASRDAASKVFGLSRAELGTTAVAHAANTALRIFQPVPDIAWAVREMVVYAYLKKDAVGSRITVINQGVVTVEDLDPNVDKVLQRHKRHQLPLAV